MKIKPLTHETLGIINNKNSSKNFVNDFSEVWEKKKYKDCKNNALTKSIFRYFICKKEFEVIKNKIIFNEIKNKIIQ